jgi:hypothetical protein
MLIGLGVAAALVGVLAHDALSVPLVMLILGEASSAADVVINSLTGLAEQQSGAASSPAPPPCFPPGS